MAKKSGVLKIVLYLAVFILAVHFGKKLFLWLKSLFQGILDFVTFNSTKKAAENAAKDLQDESTKYLTTFMNETFWRGKLQDSTATYNTAKFAISNISMILKLPNFGYYDMDRILSFMMKLPTKAAISYMFYVAKKEKFADAILVYDKIMQAGNNIAAGASLWYYKVAKNYLDELYSKPDK